MQIFLVIRLGDKKIGMKDGLYKTIAQSIFYTAYLAKEINPLVQTHGTCTILTN